MLAIDVQDASRDVSSIAATGALSALLVLLVVSALIAWWLQYSQRSQRGFVAWFAGFASVALIVSVTLFRDGLTSGFHPTGFLHWSNGGFERLSRDPLGSSQFLLNVVLFVPAGLVWTWVVKRPTAVLACLVGVSLLIECAQGITGAGVTDVADLAANGIGAALGVGVAALVSAVVRSKGVVISGRAQILAIVATSAFVVLSVSGWFIGASQRQQSVEDELQRRFANTTTDDIDALLAEDPEQLWSAISARSDGSRHLDDAIEVRYPATFFSLHRCVFVTWTKTSVTFRKASGDDCTAFLG